MKILILFLFTFNLQADEFYKLACREGPKTKIGICYVNPEHVMFIVSANEKSKVALVLTSGRKIIIEATAKDVLRIFKNKKKFNPAEYLRSADNKI